MPSDWSTIAKTAPEIKKPETLSEEAGIVVGAGSDLDSLDSIFKKLSEVKQKKGLKIGIYGGFSTGKTFFACSAEEPIFVIDTETGVAPLVRLFPEKQIFVSEVLQVSPDGNYDKDDVLTFISAIKAIDAVLSKKLEGGTIVIDSATDLWSIIQSWAKVSVFKIKPEDRLKVQWDWAVITGKYHNIIKRLMQSKMNVILTARAGREYAGAGKPTDIWDPKWQKDTEYFVDIIIFMEKVPSKTGITYRATIEKCRQNGMLVGKQFENIAWKDLVDAINSPK